MAIGMASVHGTSPSGLFAGRHWLVSCLSVALTVQLVGSTSAWSQSNLADESLFPDSPSVVDDNLVRIEYPETDEPAAWFGFANRQLSAAERQVTENATVLLTDSHGTTRTRARAARTLGTVCHVTAVEPLLQVANNEFDEIHPRVEALEALSRIPHDGVVADLTRHLNDPWVAIDAIRGLLLLQGNVLELKHEELHELVHLYHSKTAENDLPIGGYRSILSSSGGGYGPAFPESVQRLLDDNQIPVGVRTKCDEICGRYRKWCAAHPDWPLNWQRAYAYGLLHHRVTRSSEPAGLNTRDAFSRVLEANLDHPESESLVHVNLLKLERVPVHQLRNSGIFQKSQWIQDAFGKLPGIPTIAQVREDADRSPPDAKLRELLDPLQPWSSRASAATAVMGEQGELGRMALMAVAANRFDHARVRSACIARLADLDLERSRRLLIACVADPRVMDAAIHAIPGAVDELRRRQVAMGPPGLDAANRCFVAILEWTEK